MTASVRLKKSHDHRLKQGHLWIYSNEIDTQHTPLSQFQAGEIVRVTDAGGTALGIGYINPHSLITIRLLSRDVNTIIDKNFFKQRLIHALHLRQSFFTQPYYRWVFAESDLLPGLIVDRFGDHYVIQTNTAGMEHHLTEIKEALVELANPISIYLKNNSSMRMLEQLTCYEQSLLGETPEFISIEENNTRFSVPIIAGQKTGWFYDHRANRSFLAHHAANKEILDVFSYCGAWSVSAAVAGAKQVTCIDSSAQALEWLQQNAQLNGCKEKITTLCDDAFSALQRLHQDQKSFDMIVVDPPAFIKKRKDINAGKIAYERINKLALRLLKPNGLLISASCSQHFTREDMIHMFQKLNNQNKIQLQCIWEGRQDVDHPIHPNIPETNYLKAMVMRKI